MSATNTEPRAGGPGGDMTGLVTRHVCWAQTGPGPGPGEKKACWEFGSQPPESGGWGEWCRVQALWPGRVCPPVLLM